MASVPSLRRVVVFAGGRSPEHAISCESGREVLRNLNRDRWQPWPVWLEPADSAHAWVVPEPGVEVPFDIAFGVDHPGERLRPGRALAQLLDEGIAVAFPVLHGPFGEDGTIQGMLELHDVPFVGSGTAASAVAMDKIRTRECFSSRGLPVARGWVSEGPADLDPGRAAAAIEASVGYPCFLKTDLSGSTIGVRRCAGPDDVRAFLGDDARGAMRIVAEQPVAGEEISVPVLGNSADLELTPLPPIGIYPVAEEGYFSHVAKYTAGKCEEVVPPRGLDEAGIRTVQQLAIRCHRALWCDGLSRTDMIVSDDGPVVLEVNTLPGLSPASLLPKAAAAAGIEFANLLDLLIDAALRRHGATP